MIAGFFGIMSSGKGVMSTRFLRWLNSNNPKRIISNCWLNEKNLIILTTEGLYLKSKDPDFFRNSYLYITELHNIIDARRSSSLLNTNFTQFLTQIGKLDCNVVYDAQMFESQIDLRMRDFTTLRFFCERYLYTKGQLIDATFQPRVVKEQIAIKTDMQIQRSNGTIQQKSLGYYLPTTEDYEYYKTREIITLDRDKFLRK